MGGYRCEVVTGEAAVTDEGVTVRDYCCEVVTGIRYRCNVVTFIDYRCKVITGRGYSCKDVTVGDRCCELVTVLDYRCKVVTVITVAKLQRWPCHSSSKLLLLYQPQTSPKRSTTNYAPVALDM